MIVTLGLRDEEGIAQNIRTILLTEKGSIPFRPKMGVGSYTLLDTNMDQMDMSLEIIDQINTYEPRVTVKEVKFRTGETASHMRVTIFYQIIETGEEKSYIHES